jgi:hypothetical protein
MASFFGVTLKARGPTIADLEAPKTKTDGIVVTCPHCQCPFEVEEGNCLVFRHAVDKKTLNPIAPHTPKAECEMLLREEKIIGCGKPVRLAYDKSARMWIGEVCDYI